MKRIRILLLLCMFASKVKAQNNPIFFGGNGDGIAATNYSQNYTPQANLGGDGFGWIANGYAQSTDFPNYLGGDGFGWVQNQYLQNRPDVSVFGGEGDGQASLSYNQLRPDVSVFGGVGDGWVGALFPLGPLPIDNFVFTGKIENNKHVLQWVSTQENEWSHFVIEQSIDGNHFTEVGMRNAKGNTTGTSNYEFEYAKFLVGNNFYRIKIVKDDNTFELSNIVLLQNKPTQLQIAMYPNPASTQLFLQIASVVPNTQAQISICNSNGKIVYTNTIMSNNQIVEIPIVAWAAGYYFATIKQGLSIQSIKLSKL
jgi:hypothetical protein